MSDHKIEDYELPAWPDCVVPGCRNKSCLALGSPFCFPHTPGTREQKLRTIEKHHAEDIEIIEATNE